MTNPILALDGASLHLPDGRALFSNICHQFDLRRTGLVGRNGVGKSMLARLLAGELAPTAGRVLRAGSVFYLSQQAGSGQVAALAGIDAITGALARIEAGSADSIDFDAVGERWDIAARLEAACRDHGLAGVTLDTPVASLSGGQAMRVAVLGGVLLPYVAAPFDRIDLGIMGRQRLGIVGPSGCGKSTLLKVLAGQLNPVAGQCSAPRRVAYLDQRLGSLDPARTALEQLLDVNRSVAPDMLRTWLVQLGLDAQTVTRPSGLLSRGERLKAALACALYADTPPALLLLDEPTNHLDLASLAALEAMLNAYRGALAVVSHDRVFMARIELTHRLSAQPGGWRLEAC